MAVKASAAVTLSSIRDIQSCTRYYLLQSSTLATPSKPTVKPPEGSWSAAEPGYSEGSTSSLYFCDLTVFTDGSYAYSNVSLSSSYEAAKEAWNKAQSARSAATAAQASADAAQATADAAEATAAQVRATFHFDSDGLRTRVSGSKWSTLTAEDGFYIDHDDVPGHVGAFYQERFEARSMRLMRSDGSTLTVRPTSGGGWVWN